MMRNLRLGLLLVSVVAIVIFIQQNLSPVLPLTFLGMKTVAFPLSLWILFALAAGVLTAQLVVMLLQISLAASQRSSVRDRPRDPRANRSVDDRQTPDAPYAQARSKSDESPYSNPEKNTNYTDSFTNPSKAAKDFGTVRDWQDDSRNWVDDDEVEQNWVDDKENWVDEPIEPGTKSSKNPPVTPQKTDYEVPKSPTSEYRSGTIYSYSYRKPENTGVGITESVNDAEYRVIIPPNSEHEEQSGESAAGEYSSNDYVDRKYSSDEYTSDEYSNDEYSSDEYSSDEYSSDEYSSDEPLKPEIVAPTPEPKPPSTPVYKPEVEPVRFREAERQSESPQTKIQTNNQTNNNDDDDWSKPSKKNNEDWV
jgi:uncharacterized integral membrane protein